MDIQYVYTRKRNEFHRSINFTDRPAEILAEIEPNYDLLKEFIYRNPIDTGIQHTIQLSEHEVNTNRYENETKGFNHTEGGWPKDVNIQEQDQTSRYRKKIEKDEHYLQSFSKLIHDLEINIKQNNAIDIHENYFQDKTETSNETFHLKTINLYNYSFNQNSFVNHICWQPDGQRQLAVSYANSDSLVWDIENPNQPEIILKSNSSLNTMEFNPKDTNQILAGCANGQVCLFDLRKGRKPVEESLIEFSHRESVRNALWLQSKSGTEFFSASTDGQIFWWDTKKLSEPVEKLIFDLEKKERIQYATGITKLEYDLSIPTKFMVGTETGRIVQCTRKAKNEMERINVIYPGHQGPIYALQRHPFFNKFFLSIDQWTLKIWSEEIRDDFIFSTKTGRFSLTDAKWCLGRPAVFICSTREGCVHIWDLLFKQDEPTLIIKLSEEAISCLSCHGQGRYLACGTTNGNVILTELSDSLCLLDQNEKQLVASIFDRETRRTHLLDIRSRLKTEKPNRNLSFPSADELNEQFHQSTDDFWSMIKKEKDNLLFS